MSAPICGAPNGTSCYRDCNCSGCIYELKEKTTKEKERKTMICSGAFSCKDETCAHRVEHNEYPGCVSKCGKLKNLDITCKEKTMIKTGLISKEIAEVKVSDLKKAYTEGCEDVKATLKRMYPDVFEVEYCCKYYKRATEDGFIEDKMFVGKEFGCGYRWLSYCPYCGKITKL